MAATRFDDDSHGATGAPRQQIDAAQAIEFIAQLESHWFRASWQVESCSGWLTDLSDLDSLKQAPTYHRAQVICEPASGRIRCAMEAATRWAQGSDPHLARIAAYGLNGAQEQWWEILKPGLAPLISGVRIAGRGQIGPEDEAIRDYAFGNCYAYCFPPYFYYHRLSTALRTHQDRNKPIDIYVLDDGSWNIDCFDFTCSDEEWNRDCRLQLSFDPLHGGVVTGALWSEVVPAKSANPIPWRKMFVELAELPGGFWAPTRVDFVNLLDRSTDRISFTHIRRNPPVAEDKFRISIPSGIRVTDQIQNTAYVAGEPFADDERPVRAFMDRYQLVDTETACAGVAESC